MVAAAIIGSAVVGAGATAYGASQSSKAAKKAAQAQERAAAENNALQREIYGKNEGYLSPTIARGNVAGDRLSAFLGLGGDSGAAQQAFDQYLDSTGYKFTMESGRDAITSSRATSGLLKSGSTLKALTRFGQNTAQGYTQNYLANLAGVAGSGMTAASALAGVGQNYAGAVGQNNQNAADAIGNAGLISAANTNAMIGQGISALGQVVGQSSYGAPKSVFRPYSTGPGNIGYTGSGMGGLY